MAHIHYQFRVSSTTPPSSLVLLTYHTVRGIWNAATQSWEWDEVSPPWPQMSTVRTKSSSWRKVGEMHPGCPALRRRAAHVMPSSEFQEKNFPLLHWLWLLVVRSINMDYVKEPTSLWISSISSRLSGGSISAQPFKGTRSVSALFLQWDPLAGQTASNRHSCHREYKSSVRGHRSPHAASGPTVQQEHQCQRRDQVAARGPIVSVETQ